MKRLCAKVCHPVEIIRSQNPSLKILKACTDNNVFIQAENKLEKGVHFDIPISSESDLE